MPSSRADLRAEPGPTGGERQDGGLQDGGRQDAVRSLDLAVGGMTCSSCALRVE